MHELSLCQNLLHQVQEIARQQNATHIKLIQVKIGTLSGVAAESLEHAFPIASVGTIAEGAQLSIKIVPARVQCESCGAESDVETNKLNCATCGDENTRLISGSEMLLENIEIEGGQTCV